MINEIRKHIVNNLEDTQKGISLYASIQIHESQKLEDFKQGRGLRQLTSLDFWQAIIRKLSFLENNGLIPKPESKKEEPKIEEQAPKPLTEQVIIQNETEQFEENDPPEVVADRITLGKISNQMKKFQRELGDLIFANNGKENTQDNLVARNPLVEKITKLAKELSEVQKRIKHWEENGEYITASPERQDLLELQQKLRNLSSRISKTKKNVETLEKELELSPGHSKTKEKLDEQKSKLAMLQEERRNLKVEIENIKNN